MQVTVEEAAKIRNCHPSTIRRAIKAGAMKAEKKLQNNRMVLFVEIEKVEEVEDQEQPEPENSDLIRELREEITFLRGHVSDLMRQLPPAPSAYPNAAKRAWWKLW